MLVPSWIVWGWGVGSTGDVGERSRWTIEQSVKKDLCIALPSCSLSVYSEREKRREIIIIIIISSWLAPFFPFFSSFLVLRFVKEHILCVGRTELEAYCQFRLLSSSTRLSLSLCICDSIGSFWLLCEEECTLG